MGGSGRGRGVARLLGAAAPARPRRLMPALAALEGAGDPGAAAAAAGAAAAGRAGAPATGRPASARGVQPLAAEVVVADVLRFAGDAAPLASAAGRTVLDVPRALRTPADRARRRRTGAAAGARESALGLQADPG